jgi:CRISPR-associated endonuclease Csn1
LRKANQIKGERHPFKARKIFEDQGWNYDEIIARVQNWPPQKRYRFGEDAMKKWKGRADTYLARSLNDTRYLSRVAHEYLRLICPQGTRVIPGKMTAMLRGKFGLNAILGSDGKKNRNDHRHHAVDACVIGVTDQGMMNSFAKASASARKKGLYQLVENMPSPWPEEGRLTYREHVQRAINAIWVSHKPDHGYEGRMMEETSYGIHRDGSIKQRREADGNAGREISNLIRIVEPNQPQRHGVDAEGRPLPYKGYVGGSNYCIEIVCNDKGRWQGKVITTFSVYQRIATEIKKLRSQGLSYEDARHQAEKQLRCKISASGEPLVMRLHKEDIIRAEIDGQTKLLRVVKIDPSTNVVFAEIHEAGELKKRHDDSRDTFRYVNLRGESFRNAKARHVTISPIGELRDPGFKE